MNDREMMQKSLESIVYYAGGEDNLYGEDKDLLKALRDRLTQPEPEPAENEQAVIDQFLHNNFSALNTITAPPKREWVGLTHEEAKRLVEDYGNDPLNLLFQNEAKLKEMNHG